MYYLFLELKEFKRFSLNKITLFSVTLTNPIQIILGTNGSGKAQPLDTLIKVPNGWDYMGNMKVGTEVIAKDGSITKVNAVYPQGIKEIFKITFSDGRSTECCGEHLWKVYTGGKEYPIIPKVMNTLELIRRLSMKSMSNLLWVDLCDSEQNADINLPLDPYLLGVFLGDGSARGSPNITTPDTFIIDKIKQLLPSECMLSDGYSRQINKNGDPDCYTYGIKKKPDSKINTFTKHLVDLDLYNKICYDKHIPEIYLNGSTKQRLTLLQGLLDTDGYINKNSTVSYCSTSQNLAYGVAYLIRSLGGIASVSTKFTHNGEYRSGRIAYIVNIRYKTPSELFTLPKKKDRANDNGQYNATLKLIVKSIESIGFKEAQCISIDLYITDDFIVTHNSSLINQLTPLPAMSSDYEKTGSKTIKISHNNSIYLLKSIFSPSQKHSFIKDDIEYNEGGTLTVQRELVKAHFNITHEIQDLITGQIKFTEMPPAKRKEWMLQCCDTDYDYAIAVYSKLKDKLRDINGALKLGKKRLLIESEKILKTDEQTKLECSVKEYHNQLNLLIEYRKPIEDDIHTLRLNQEQIQTRITRLSNALEDLINTPIEDTSEEEIQKVSDEITYTQAQSDEYGKLYKENQDKIDILIRAEKQTIEELHSSKLLIDNEILSIESRLLVLIDNKDIANLRQSFNSVKPILIDILSTLKPNNDKKYSTINLDNSNKKITELTISKNNCIEKKQEVTTRLKHMTAHRDNPEQHCPKCGHNYSLNYNEKTYKYLEQNLNDLTIKLDSLSKEITELESYIIQCNEYFVNYRQLMQCLNNYLTLKDYWIYIKEKNLILNDPLSVINLLNIIDKDIDLQVLKLNLIEKSNVKGALLSSLKDVGGSDLNTLQQSNREIEKRIQSLIEALQSKLNKKKILQSSLAHKRNIKNYSIKLREFMRENISLHKREKETVRRSIFNEIIKSIQSQLAQSEHILSMAKSQRSIIDNIEQNIKELEVQEMSLNLLCKTLSPSEGLIAQGMFGFIHNFINQINSFISRVWTYPMEIKFDTPLEDNILDLDFKFPLVTHKGNTPIADVSLGSNGMKEIINLAFTITAMKYLNLQNTPLVLDELGITMDQSHKGSIIQLIKSLIEQGTFSQVFIISHDYAQYSAISNADMIVLCSNNIMLPSKYNEHVIMEKL